MNAPAHTSARTLGEKTFVHADQQRFATESRDWNPMHVDAVAARRLLSGRQVVHGVHTLLHALDLCELPAGSAPWKLHCNFANPVSVGDTVVFTQRDEGDGRVQLVASVGALACTEMVIEPAAALPPPLAPASGSSARQIGELAQALDEAAGTQAGVDFGIAAWPDALAAQFPRAAQLVGAQALSALARLSFFVGMVCPGLHSVFSSLQFVLVPQAAADSRLRVRKFDPRFRLFVVDFDGPVRGELRAFLRPPPQPQPRAAEVAAGFAGDEFRGMRALVIGGSRGLGEVTAKIVAAGGGDVIITYAAGQADAQAVADDINEAGRGRCEVRAADLSQAFAGIAGLEPAALDTVYYFATPRIYTKRSEVFDRAAFDEFTGFYLQRLHELCLWLEAAERERPALVYLPSTVFIDERPKGMTEYTMAKAAAEVLADDLNRSLRNVRIVHTRLPRLATDQTSSILKLSLASNLDAMSAVVRQMSSAISSL